MTHHYTEPKLYHPIQRFHNVEKRNWENDSVGNISDRNRGYTFRYRAVTSTVVDVETVSLCLWTSEKNRCETKYGWSQERKVSWTVLEARSDVYVVWMQCCFVGRVKRKVIKLEEKQAFTSTKEMNHDINVNWPAWLTRVASRRVVNSISICWFWNDET
jgi:hypothetical protein